MSVLLAQHISKNTSSTQPGGAFIGKVQKKCRLPKERRHLKTFM
ncbi:hypothetical protein ACM0P6_11210 [Komagataeibacter sucrofermentans]|nr:hypothetical protein [Komagataeibacter sucrofermentans]